MNLKPRIWELRNLGLSKIWQGAGLDGPARRAPLTRGAADGLPPLPPTSDVVFICYCVCVFGVAGLWVNGVVCLGVGSVCEFVDVFVCLCVCDVFVCLCGCVSVALCVSVCLCAYVFACLWVCGFVGLSWFACFVVICLFVCFACVCPISKVHTWH